MTTLPDTSRIKNLRQARDLGYLALAAFCLLATNANFGLALPLASVGAAGVWSVRRRGHLPSLLAAAVVALLLAALASQPYPAPADAFLRLSVTGLQFFALTYLLGTAAVLLEPRAIPAEIGIAPEHGRQFSIARVMGWTVCIGVLLALGRQTDLDADTVFVLVALLPAASLLTLLGAVMILAVDLPWPVRGAAAGVCVLISLSAPIELEGAILCLCLLLLSFRYIDHISSTSF